MKNLTCCVLSAILLSSMPAFALTITPPVSEVEKVRNTHHLFISSKKVVKKETIEKGRYGYSAHLNYHGMIIELMGSNESFL
ncbi:Uncharacterised protein [Moraxella lacunata]|uniref:Uncharacterized protein n=1 Tax=Moraxella lacunata TaxID=477 RepID=A0A1V4GPM0_MORLA|nr:hypothetical protein [Moraxella lacunata]OPH34574.1 hypothetical protein B5J94_11085 [Moraxella lacunata]STY99976.1 Uncharacterised protein [Moraxella lacunata]